MTIADSEITATAARAGSRFTDHKVEIAYRVCLPVYEVRLRVIEMAEHSLSTTARFILQLVDLRVEQPSEIGRLLGLEHRYVVDAAAELLSGEFARQHPDLRLEITESGKEAVAKGGRALRPKNRHPQIAYDPLMKRVADVDTRELLSHREVQGDGQFVVQVGPRPPRLNNIRVEDVRRYDESYTRRENDSEILEVADVKDSRLKYRNDTILVKLDAPGSDASTFAVYRARQYLAEESAEIQRLADRGVDLVPLELRPDLSQLNYSVAASQEEIGLMSEIRRLHHGVVDKERDVDSAKAGREDSATAVERERQDGKIAQRESEKREMEKRIAELERQLYEATRGDARLIVTEEHRGVLIEAIEAARNELTLVSAWIDPYAFDHELRSKVAAAVKRGATVRIGYGLGQAQNQGHNGYRNQQKAKKALDELRKLIPRDLKSRLVVVCAETHEKYIISDDWFCAAGSHNWLSYRGNVDSAYRRETSLYSERPDDIRLYKERADEIFRG